MKKVNKEFPLSFEIGGKIEVNKSNIILIQDNNDRVIGAKLQLNLNANFNINGLGFEAFEIKTNHRLSDFEFNEFMEKVMIEK